MINQRQFKTFLIQEPQNYKNAVDNSLIPIITQSKCHASFGSSGLVSKYSNYVFMQGLL